MKKNIIVAHLVDAASMTTVSAFAADGQIKFTGAVIDTACDVTNAASGCPAGVDSVNVKFDGTTVAGDSSVLTLLFLR